MKNYFLPLAKTSLILVYVVIFAGALVRMTGSGMGCPDWPKCFGYYIPPTDISEILWQPNHEFKKGQVIIHDESLWVAKEDFTTTDVYQEQHWTKYTKHDYATFNAKHTWTEYLNRLSGAIAGVACLVMAVFSFAYWRTQKKLVLLSWLVVFLMGFQAWLGATVVFSVLNPIKITVHMIMALVIVAILIYIVRVARVKKEPKKNDSKFIIFLYISLLLTLIQVVLGTQVRQFVDEQVRAGIGNEYLWLNDPTFEFYIHRTFSFIVVFVNLFLFLRNRRKELGYRKLNWVMILLALEIFSGIAMYYWHFPFGAQTAHLVVASLLFGVQFYLVLEAQKTYFTTTKSKS